MNQVIYQIALIIAFICPVTSSFGADVDKKTFNVLYKVPSQLIKDGRVDNVPFIEPNKLMAFNYFEYINTYVQNEKYADYVFSKRYFKILGQIERKSVRQISIHKFTFNFFTPSVNGISGPLWHTPVINATIKNKSWIDAGAIQLICRGGMDHKLQIPILEDCDEENEVAAVPLKPQIQVNMGSTGLESK